VQSPELLAARGKFQKIQEPVSIKPPPYIPRTSQTTIDSMCQLVMNVCCMVLPFGMLSYDDTRHKLFKLFLAASTTTKALGCDATKEGRRICIYPGIPE